MNELVAASKAQALQCRINARSYQIWRSTLVPANILFVVGGALLSLIAGSSLLIDQKIICPKTAGVLALISAAFALIHSKLNCDPHQAECKKLMNSYRGLEQDYLNLEIIDDKAEFKKKFQEINTELSHVIKNSNADPSSWAIKKAGKENV